MSETISHNRHNILVIGGAGYVGSRLVPRLLEDGHMVSVVDMLWFGDHLPSAVPVHKRDALDLNTEAFKGFDTVLFLAGLSNDPMAEFDARQNFISNAPTPAYCAMMAKKAGVKRFIYASSCSVYGFTNEEEVTENSKPLSQFHYGVSKLMGETGCWQYQDDHFDVVVLRKGTISGWSPRMRYDLLLNTMFMKAATEHAIDVRNHALWRPVLAMDDAVRAYIWALDCPRGIYNILSKNYTIGECARLVSEFFKHQYGIEVAVNHQHLPDNRNYKASNVKAMTAGFVPQGTADSVVHELGEKLGLHADFANDTGYNIRIFQNL